ncbi:Phospholipase d active site-containing protein [Lasiodiplodia theobromae]|uniref:Phospholipase d active site-containing protein n=1 Tax=Lasiodiplodia theobromae TaxID=45133 RepID=UPI0015C3027A|nr:Phospholipase d active site-containing protein [Lasiodiplodia theobromae]KAF4546230.1 Phospholipase d active site-containing protein [Lasiodiplodia theobromae]
MSNDHDDNLAYGDYHGDESGERGLIGDFGRRFLGERAEAEPSDITSAHRRPLHHPFSPHSAQPQGEPTHYEPYSTQKPPPMASFFNKVGELFTGHEEEAPTTHEQVSTAAAETAQEGAQKYADHRFLSFAPQRHDNNVKWFVDGCGYMWAVSEALERAKESIWILDWWLSPELYLRRPPAKNQMYRLDRMLQAAAERGVKVNVIVYKEVEQALTRKYLSPWLPGYLHSLFPDSTDPITRALARVGLDVIFKSLDYAEATDPLIAPPVTVSSKHTKHHLEGLHPNIAVQRHPDHYVDHNTLTQDLIDEFKGFTLSAKSISTAPWDAFKAIYGSNQDTVLFWAHHEKLCLIDGEIAFMGGLDLCYGRWDTNQHEIADVHPGDLNKIVWPGQDYNNARIMDFQDVENWQNNKLSREQSSRMGWSDVALSLNGPVVADLQEHFTQRWNYIFHEKYKIKNDGRFERLSVKKPAPKQQDDDLAYGEEDSGYGFRKTLTSLSHHAHHQFQRAEHHFGYGQQEQQPESEIHEGSNDRAGTGAAAIQLTRSCAEWSHGCKVEHSIQNAYIETIKNSKHFIYIENQFFITATCEDQKPIKNMIGAAIVERVLRAHKNGEKWRAIVMIPAVPAFPGDLKSDEALSTRAIMEFQYKSINRGKGKSIYETIAAEGINPMEYIRFYNLRNYDRLNISGSLEKAEENAGVSYEEAREEHDRKYGGRYQEREGEDDGYPRGDDEEDRYREYQQGARDISRDRGLGSGKWDSVSECYMLGGEDIRNVPWSGSTPEIDAFVTEELYIHSKLLIADDRIVICGSANLNDRSQLGFHDSEIAVVIEDPTPCDSLMDGQEWRASKFAASLRRQITRKHLGLLPWQDYTRPDENFRPIGVPNRYDWGSREDELVVDPISDDFLNLWNTTAKTNTDAFAEVFHAVPYDGVRTWDQYDDYYERYFKDDEEEKEKKDEEAKEDGGHEGKPRRYKRGHVISENFAPGEEGARQVKEILSRVRGMLVEMPLLFLKDEDVAKNGVQLNAFTEEVYT